jgi:hypothetical protein
VIPRDGCGFWRRVAIVRAMIHVTAWRCGIVLTS